MIFPRNLIFPDKVYIASMCIDMRSTKSTRVYNYKNFKKYFICFIFYRVSVREIDKIYTDYYNVAGYGFVDFESPMAAEGAVKALVAKGIQAQMAKVGIWLLRRLDSVRGCACKYRVIPE